MAEVCILMSAVSLVTSDLSLLCFSVRLSRSIFQMHTSNVHNLFCTSLTLADDCVAGDTDTSRVSEWFPLGDLGK